MAELLKLTDENYYSNEANKQYMSVSQFKSFLPQYGGCEAKAMAELDGNYVRPGSTAFLVGSYAHSHFEGTLGKFKAEHPQIFTKQGELKAEYRKANEMIQSVEDSEECMKFLIGDKEVIRTGELFGIQWKTKMDVLNREKGFLTDFKTCKDFSPIYNREFKDYFTFVEEYGYDIQMAVYREIEALAEGKDRLQTFMVAVTKQDVPDKAILFFTEDDHRLALNEVEKNISRIVQVKSGQIEPERCEKCDYCRATKKVKPVYFRDL